MTYKMKKVFEIALEDRQFHIFGADTKSMRTYGGITALCVAVASRGKNLKDNVHEQCINCKL